MVQVIKRNCEEVDFDKNKIVTAIMKSMKFGSGIVRPQIAETIADEIYEENKYKDEISVSEIESAVFDKLITKKQRLTAKAYEGYRSIREFQRENENTIDEDISELIEDQNEYWKEENTNKNPMLNTTKRDYLAGIISTDATRRYLLPPEIVQAHDEGIIHFHDADYFLQHLHNCFHSKTRFYTSEGIKAFKDFHDGDKVRVLDKNGTFRDATVKKYGKQTMQEVIFTTSQREKKVVCTPNHRWILKDGSVTTNLSVGDTLLGINEKDTPFSSTHQESMFTLGFLVGDGCDHTSGNSEYHQIRLCGHKTEYANIFKNAGYSVKPIKNSNDLIAIKKGFKKEKFLNSYAWKYLGEEDKRWLFLGLYAADGGTTANRLATTDERIIDLVEETSYTAGYFISSISSSVRDTEYKKDALIYYIHFVKSQPANMCWKVKSIKPVHGETAYDAWCIEEPITHSFILEGGMITGNCDLINLEDMLQNGTVISETLIETPHSFSTACTVTTQIIAQVASSQYGGQSMSLSHLVPFVDVSRQKIKKEVIHELYDVAGCLNNDESIVNEITEQRLLKEIRAGIQTIQYQLITIMTTNGQAPFITLLLYLNEVAEGRERNDLALLIEETLRQRIQGIKNEVGEWIAPAFPKLIYVLQENNITEGTEYWYLTKLAAECSAQRLVPDYVSEKIMLELKGDVYTPMGCVQGEEVVTYKYNHQLYVESFKRMWNRLSNYYEIKEQIPDNKDYLYFDIDDNAVDVYDTDKGFVKVKRLIRNKSDEWVNVKIRHGRSLICTPDHPFHTQRGRIRADELTQDDIVTINPNQYFEENQIYNQDKAWLMGFILCDGCYDNHVSCSIAYDSEDDIQNAYIKRMKECFDSDVDVIVRERGKKGNYKDLVSRGSVGDMIDYFSTTFEGLTKLRRHIPNEVFSWDYIAKLNFLAGMIDADGYINATAHGGSVVQLGSTNKELALQQAALARALGMSAAIYQNHYSQINKNAIRYRVEFAPSEELLTYIISEKKKNNFIERTTEDVFINAEINSVEKIEGISEYSYDLTTESDHFEVSAIYSHNCRSFLTPDRFTEAGLGNIAKAKNYVPGEHKYYGRFNQGVVTLNLVDIALSSEGDMDEFWELFNERTELCHKALRIRHERLKGTVADVSPILWRYGALARLDKGEKIDELLYHGYSTISLGYAGLYECVKYMTGHSHSDGGIGEEFGLEIMQRMNDKCAEWKATEDIDYSIYGTPLETTTYKFAKCLQNRFGIIEGITDRNYITNSYHIPVFEEIDAFEKLRIEAKFQKLSPGGAISYIETPSMTHNPDALLPVLQYMYDNILYAEINTKSCYCEKCGYDGDIPLVEDENNRLVWECPNCGNRDASTMDIAFRTCGYIGTAKNGGNQGRYGDIHDRVYHLSDFECDW